MCTVHIAPGPGTGPDTGKWLMGFQPIFPDLILIPEMCCNGFLNISTALFIYYALFECRLLPATMARIRKKCRIVRKCTKQRRERRVRHIIIIFLLWQLQQVNRDIWVHPLNEERTEKGEFYTHYTDHRQFEDRFFELYRMTVAQFDELLYIVGPRILKQETNFRRPLSPEERLAITIRYVIVSTFIHYSVKQSKYYAAQTSRTITVIS